MAEGFAVEEEGFDHGAAVVLLEGVEVLGAAEQVARRRGVGVIVVTTVEQPPRKATK